jgi:hypothetical protein
MSRKISKGLTELTRRGIRERDPTKWKVLKVEEGDDGDPVVTFQAGTYTNKAGMEIPVIFHCAKSGIIYRTWHAEMERRQRAKSMEGIESGVIELKEGEIIEIDAKPVGKPLGKPLVEVFATGKEAEEVTSELDRAARMLELEDRKELAGIQWRLEGLRAHLQTLPYCNHEKDICTTECKVREEIRELEKKCLRDP